jgi:outer membrane receptor protein involved in Fe transport
MPWSSLRLYRISGFVLLVLVFALQCRAQTATGSISGIVRDQTGAVIARAKVTATNTLTNESRSTATNDTGYYSFPLMPPGIYNVEAESAGFKRFVRENIKLDVALAAAIDLTLDVGQNTERVTVTSEAPLLEENTSSLGHIVENRRITDLPTNGRNSYGFAVLVPGVRASRGFGQVALTMYSDQFISVNGSRPNQSTFLLDGGANSNSAFNGPAFFPSIDAVQEYKVQTNNFSAEFAGSAGGVINLVTKTGTNQAHGSLYEFFRHDKLTANDFFLNRAARDRGVFRYNQFGASFGGPLMIPHLYNGKDRTFFFASYEGLRFIQAATVIGNMPTELQRIGDFSQTRTANSALITIYDPNTLRTESPGQLIRSPFPGNIVPADRFDPVARALVGYFPHPNTVGNAITGAANYTGSFPAPNQKDTGSMRVDHVLTSRQRLFARASVNMTFQGRPPIYGKELAVAAWTAGNDQLNQTSNVLNYTNLLLPNLVLELSSSFNRYTIRRKGPARGFDPVPLGFPEYFHSLQPRLVPCFPTVQVVGINSSSNVAGIGGPGIGICDPTNDDYDTFHEYGNLTLVRGPHNLKMGGDFGAKRLATRRFETAVPSYSFGPNFTQGPNPLVGSSNAGLGWASFLLGLGAGGNIRSDTATAAVQYKYYGWYFQDDWKLNSRLTLNLGVRYDYEEPWTERYNRLTDLDYNSPVSIAGLSLRGGLAFPGVRGLSRYQFNPDKNNFAPRFGYAFRLQKNTVLRGGYGIFFSPSSGGGFNGPAVPQDGFFANTDWVPTIDGVTPVARLSNPFPNGFVLAPGSTLGLTTLLGQSVTGMDRSRRMSYAQQWNFDIQRSLPGNILMDLAYAGSRGIDLYGSLNYDLLPNQYLSLGDRLRDQLPNPFFGLISSGALSGATVSRAQLLRPYPQYTGFTAGNLSYGASTYHSLQAKLERRFSAGFSFLLAYTFSKLLDDVDASTTGFPGETFSGGGIQDFYNRRNERAVAVFDTPHSAVLNWLWEVPVGKGKRLITHNRALDLALGGWQINGIYLFRSGVPLQLTTASNNLFNFGAQRPNSNGKDPNLSGPISQRLDRYFNTDVFSAPAPYTLGNTPRLLSNLRAPGLSSLDASLFKDFKLKEQFQLQFRVEAFNITNTPQFGLPITTIGSPTAGVIGTQANLPRTVQFALKLVF